MRKIALLIFALIWLLTNEVYACTCVEINESFGKKIEKAFSKSDLIFVGKVIDQQFKETEIYVPELDSKQKYSRAIYTFELINLFRGQPDKEEIEIVTTASSSSCGFEFQVGEVYLVYSNQYNQRIAFSPYLNQERVNPFYATDICTRTEKVNKVEKIEIRKLKRMAKRKT